MIVLTKQGGVLAPFANALGFIMDWIFKFTSSFGVMNIGLCIILFTFVTKLLMFPLTIKQQKSSKLMSIMQPEIQAIQKKYKNKKDQDSMMKQNVEIQAVYEKYGTSMTGGCLPLIIQMPILFALYRIIYNIPAYVSSVKAVFENVVNVLPANAPEILTQFAADNKISMAGIGELANSNKIIDLLYKFTPENWESLEVLFPSISDVISQSAASIASMNSFMGINLATSPWTGFVPSVAWLIPVLAGLSQLISTKLMTSAQPMSDDTPGAASMKTMNTTMPIMSAVFCFTFPAGVGIYWIASSVFQIIQQLIVNSYMNNVDLDEMIKRNLEKANKKRAKKGLPPAKISQNATASVKNIQSVKVEDENEDIDKSLKREEQIKEATAYYSKDPKPGSLAAKVNMVQKYNEKHTK